MKRVSPNSLEHRLEAMLEGWQRGPAPTSDIKILGQPHTHQQVTDLLKAHLQLFKEVRLAQLALRERVKARESQKASMRYLLFGVDVLLRVHLGRSDAGLTRFGLKPQKPPARLSPAARVAANAKSRATRMARRAPPSLPAAPDRVITCARTGAPVLCEPGPDKGPTPPKA